MISFGYYYICINVCAGATVHGKNCSKLQPEGKAFLGSFYEYRQAVAAARGRHPDISQCPDCLRSRGRTAEPVTVVRTTKTRSCQKARITETRTEFVQPVISKSAAAPAITRSRSGTRFTPSSVPEPQAKSGVNRVPIKHLPRR